MELLSSVRSHSMRTPKAPQCRCQSGPWTESFRDRRFGLFGCAGGDCYRIDPPPISPGVENEAFHTGYDRAGTPTAATPNMESGHYRLLGRRWTGMLTSHAHIETPLCRPENYYRQALRGDVKGTVWRAYQELGALHGRLVHSGPMLCAVGSKAPQSFDRWSLWL